MDESNTIRDAHTYDGKTSKESYKFVKTHVLWALNVSKDKSVESVGVKYSTEFNDSFWSTKYGELRGGSQGIVFNTTHFISAFHSTSTIPLTATMVEFNHNYYMGLYLIERQPPFKVTGMSRRPIGLESFYYGNISMGSLSYVSV
jgi:hypothetical protein